MDSIFKFSSTLCTSGKGWSILTFLYSLVPVFSWVGLSSGIMAMFLACVLTMVLMLIGVAFFIVLERKGLGIVQLRHGPNKPSLKGILQAVADGLKLLSKGLVLPFKANIGLFVFGPLLLFILSFSLWIIFPSGFPSFYLKYGLFFFLAVSACNVFGLIVCGWSSNSSYAMLGSMRAVAQSISYEVSMATLLLCPLLFCGGFDLLKVEESGMFLFGVCGEAGVLWYISILAETNRAPFDFVEGESELVAGYHVEMGGFLFALIALSEYGSMILMGVMTEVLFFGFSSGGVICTGLIVGISMSFILIRGVVPRYRYDMLMDFCWKGVLPLSLCVFVMYLVM
uniref:NADH-ubiquinone oxidoreductase chain 1 n=1 Tax=Vasticardium flavum TaxID=80826 RepID=A0A516IDJ7_9BIVA|nr:NADH dehydrogenase subunit 1 [Vasticardium flavum]